MSSFIKKIIYFTIIACFVMPSMAQAQGGVFGGGSQKIPTIQFERNNKYMADLLSLQNQISLLRKMLDRQKAINKMADNLGALNMPFVAPAPEYEICEQLPANDLCAGTYPDLYQGYISAAVMPELLPLPKAQNINEVDSKTAKELEKSDFMWAEINCLNAECKAIIISDVTNAKSRYTIRVGDELPNGSIVESISANGVVTRRDGKTVTIEPAPSSLSQPDNQLS